METSLGSIPSLAASELMGLVNHQEFLAAQRLPTDTARMNLTTTAMEHDKTVHSALQDAVICPGGVCVCVRQIYPLVMHDCTTMGPLLCILWHV